MDYRGPDIKVDVEDIWEIAVSSFPEMANEYLRINQAVHSSRFVSSTGPKFLTPWIDLHAEIELALARDTETLHGTAEALVAALRAFSKQDSDAAEAIAEAAEEFGDEVSKLPPPFYPPKYAPAGQTEPASPHYEPFDSSGIRSASYLKEKAQYIDDLALDAAQAEFAVINPAKYLPADWFASDNGISIASKIEDLTEDHPILYQKTVGCLEGLGEGSQEPFSEFENYIENAKQALNPDKWDGDAAHTFRKDFLNAYTSISKIQATLIAALAVAANSYQQAVVEAYAGYDEILNATETALQAIINDERAKSTKAKLAVLGLVAGSWSAFLDTKIAGKVAGLLSTSVSVAGASVEVGEVTPGLYDQREAGEFDTSVSRTGAVLINAQEALQKAADRVKEFDDNITGGLTKDLDYVTNNSSSIHLPRPVFVDDPSLL